MMSPHQKPFLWEAPLPHTGLRGGIDVGGRVITAAPVSIGAIVML